MTAQLAIRVAVGLSGASWQICPLYINHARRGAAPLKYALVGSGRIPVEQRTSCVAVRSAPLQSAPLDTARPPWPPSIRRSRAAHSTPVVHASCQLFLSASISPVVDGAGGWSTMRRFASQHSFMK